ncbi:hypothetical protein [Kineothrix alysoides]|uniref:hypothetical protein n=1 Tax=Kineothrix alysoides TaxID=1469948 RepID=UPI000A9B7CDD|nr:hypothetical protein [Kineothrix alysoides]
MIWDGKAEIMWGGAWWYHTYKNTLEKQYPLVHATKVDARRKNGEKSLRILSITR